MSKVENYVSSLTNLCVSLLCPKCKEPLFIKGASFACLNQHTYDLSKKGYTNLCLSNKKADYPKELFNNRREANRLGFFSPLEKEIAYIILSHKKHSSVILDACCGEGSHISNIQEIIQHNFDENNTYKAVGFDISPDAISLAAKNKDIFWFVADIANLPFAASSFDFILDILSPAHYSEFKRTLKPGGALLKVIPNKDYLKELRDYFFSDTQKKENGNNVQEYFQKHFPSAIEKNVCYSFSFSSAEDLQKIALMTPLTTNINKKALDSFINSGIKSITVDLKILIGNYTV